ncbi:hypothetical protein Tco_1483491 [Tanacetum coccineum]
MDIFTKGALWDYWKMGGDEIEVSDDEYSDLKELERGGYTMKEHFAWRLTIIGNSIHYQDLDGMRLLENSELKDEAIRTKLSGEYENETQKEGHELCGIKTHEVSVCQIKRYKMIKYSFKDEEEYVVVKEDEYDGLTITSEEACRAYQEIFRMMDEGWMVTRTEREAEEKSNLKTSL